MWTTINDFDRMFGNMDFLRSRMNRMFEDFDNSNSGHCGWQEAEGTPLTNLYDKGENLEIKAEVPGIAKEDLNIKIQGNYLEISGSRKTDTPEGYKENRKERGAMSFTRSFTLPSDIDSGKVEASLNNGILKLVLPKSEAAKPKQVTIN